MPISDRPVYLSGQVVVRGVTPAPANLDNNYINLAITEIGGAGVSLGFSVANPGVGSGGQGTPVTVVGTFRIGPTTTVRQLRLQGGFGAGGKAVNTTASPSQITAFTR